MIRIFYQLKNQAVRSLTSLTWTRGVVILVIVGVVVTLCSRGLLYIEKRHWDNRVGELYERLIFTTYIPNITNLLKPYRYLYPSPLPKYQLKIEPDDLARLNEVIPVGFDSNLPEDSIWVPATFIVDGKRYTVEVKNRGLLPPHWKYREKSWRVRFRGDAFHGYSDLHFILPEEKGFIVEQYGYRVAEKLGLITPGSWFGRLRINNGSYGAYWVVEHWGADFLERHELSSEANLYREGAAENRPSMYKDSTNWEQYTTEPHSAGENSADIDLLIGCLNECSDGDFAERIEQLVDIDNALAWQVQTAILGDDHQDSFHNIRLYFNNVKGKFQFFPVDVNQFKFGGQLDIIYNPLVARLLTIPEFLHRRNQLLWRYVSDEATVTDDIQYYKETLDEIDSAFYRDREKRYSNNFFDDQTADRLAKLVGQYGYLRSLLELDTSESSASTPVKLYLTDDPAIRIEIATNAFSDLQIGSLVYEGEAAAPVLYHDADGNGSLDGSDELLGRLTHDAEANAWTITDVQTLLFTRRVPESIFDSETRMPLQTTTHIFFLTGVQLDTFSPKKFDIDLTNAVTGSHEKVLERYYDTRPFARIPEVTASVEDFARREPIFRLQSDGSVAISGSHRIARTIIIPRDTIVEVAAGTALSFASGASLISYSPVHVRGTPSAPVAFRSDGGGSGPWGVVGVVDVRERSSFENCSFDGGSEAYVNGIFFSGMLAVHYTDADISKCAFSSANADDAVNLKYSDVSVRDNRFSDNPSDALDCDFCTGSLEGNHFARNGGDSIDISGSRILIARNVIEGSGDKGVSVGERSYPSIFDNLLVKNAIGIEVKDLSEASIVHNTIVKNGIGLSAYIKKDIFGAPTADVVNSVIWDNDTAFQIEGASSLSISHSVVQGGYDGEAVLDRDPQLRDEGRRSFVPGDPSLAELVDTEVAKDYSWPSGRTLGATELLWSDINNGQ